MRGKKKFEGACFECTRSSSPEKPGEEEGSHLVPGGRRGVLRVPGNAVGDVDDQSAPPGRGEQHGDDDRGDEEVVQDGAGDFELQNEEDGEPGTEEEEVAFEEEVLAAHFLDELAQLRLERLR